MSDPLDELTAAPDVISSGGEDFSANSPGTPQMGACGPIRTPDGPETIMALPLSYPPGTDNAPTGYTVQVSAGKAFASTTALPRFGYTQFQP